MRDRWTEGELIFGNSRWRKFNVTDLVSTMRNNTLQHLALRNALSSCNLQLARGPLRLHTFSNVYKIYDLLLYCIHPLPVACWDFVSVILFKRQRTLHVTTWIHIPTVVYSNGVQTYTFPKSVICYFVNLTGLVLFTTDIHYHKTTFWFILAHRKRAADGNSI